MHVNINKFVACTSHISKEIAEAVFAAGRVRQFTTLCQYLYIKLLHYDETTK